MNHGRLVTAWKEAGRGAQQGGRVRFALVAPRSPLPRLQGIRTCLTQQFSTHDHRAHLAVPDVFYTDVAHHTHAPRFFSKTSTRGL